MAEYIGVTVDITLNDNHTNLRGKITQVKDSVLFLENVFFPTNNAFLHHYQVDGVNIKDLSIVAATPREAPAPYQQPQYGAPPQQAPVNSHYARQYTTPPPVAPYQPQFATPIPQIIPLSSAQPFEDPAIISMTKPPSKVSTPIAHQSHGGYQHPSPQPQQLPQQPVSAPIQTPTLPQAHAFQTPQRAPGLKTSRPQSKSQAERGQSSGADIGGVQAAFEDLSVGAHPYSAVVDSSAVEETDDGFGFSPTPVNARGQLAAKRARRGKKQQLPFQGTQVNRGLMESKVVRPGMFAGAIAQAAIGSTYSPQRGHTPRRRRNQRSRHDNGNYATEEEGWATEDVNDYKATEFDFQGNLDRFDKKTVFNQIKAEDTTAECDRLVSHNRIPTKQQPRKNFLNSENVLGQYANGQPLAEREGWNSGDRIVEETDESDESDGVGGMLSGNAADSGRSSRRALSRQSLNNSRMSRTLSNTRAGSSDNLPGSTKIPKPSFRLPTNRTCPIVTPLQMLDVERIAEIELGLTDDMMTENAGRAIAQVAIQVFGKRISASNFNALPVVIAMVGNTKSGARVIAACRHLRNHSVRVMIIGVGLEREDDLLAGVRKQLTIFRNAGGQVGRWEEMQNKIQKFDAPAELIIDGLLGIHKDFDDLRTDDQAVTYELVQFANKSKAAVLSVDVPSGVDGNSGTVSDIQDTGAFYIRANIVVALGAPKTGLLQACVNGIGIGWKLYVADIGIPNTAWRKYGTRRRHGVEFAADWIVPLHYHHYTLVGPE
ncbi:YjeF N-terminal domain-like protein [Ascodesmis nigricans]|uniref:Enhancer of mRNA-decapping protein 3 n=1 Tax=Ascodesmis nigricans TaxID=341454 RepID=A0A4S2MVB0_9PEZI|nr:YjeF N-terminal domain-like protein [Ascodesmis nigricans]